MPAQVGGNIGTPVAAMVETSRAGSMECAGAFQLSARDHLPLSRATSRVCLNVTQNHLDRHHTFANYAAAKARSVRDAARREFRGAERRRCHVRGVTPPDTCARRCGSAARARSRRALWLDGDRIVFDGAAGDATSDIPIRGRHNVENVMAAAAAAHLAGVPLQAIAAAVRTFHAVEHRLEFVREGRRRRFL